MQVVGIKQLCRLKIGKFVDDLLQIGNGLILEQTRSLNKLNQLIF